MKVPFYRVRLTDAEVEEVVRTLRSGWLTTGPVTRRFEEAFAEAVGGAHAIAVNSCTAALHLAVEALGLRAGQAVLIPTLTFAATAEVIRYQGAFPVLVDGDPVTGHLDLDDAARKVNDVRRGRFASIPPDAPVVGVIPVHTGGLMMDVDRVSQFARAHRLWVIEDAAHAFPAAWRASPEQPWQRCGQGTSAVACFSFYANKTLTTGEGGMAVTDDADLAARMRMMALHGLSRDAWTRYSAGGSWDYQIVAPGYKYNLTDIASALGVRQLEHAEPMRQRRAALARAYTTAFADLDVVDLPPDPPDRLHAWHLYPIRLRLDRLTIDRNAFIRALADAGVGCSVHWRPLHLHAYYQEQLGWTADHCPTAAREWLRLVSLPLFPDMGDEEQAHVIAAVRRLAAAHRL